MPSIVNLSYPNFEVIVVDDVSLDDTINYIAQNCLSIKTIAKPPIRTKLKSRFGLNASSFWNENNNLGIRNSSGDYIWLLNNDVEVEKDSLFQLVNFMESNPDVGICSPLIFYNNNKQMIQCAGINFTKFGIASTVGTGLKNVRLTEPYEITYPMGAALFMRREIYHILNGLDEEVLALGDDIDFSLRCWLEGYRIMLVPKAKVYHVWGASVNKVMTWKIFNSTIGTVQTILRNLEIRTVFLAVPFFLTYNFMISSYYATKDRNPGYLLALLASTIFSLRNFKKTIVKRLIIQKKRKVSDKRFLNLTKRNFVVRIKQI